MNLRKTMTMAVLVAAVAMSGFALSSEHQDWGKGPVQYLMTKEEAAQWKSIKDDAAADAFIALFWARRDPTVGTPQNEFKDEFDAKVKYADEKFVAGRKKGSLTDRGRVFILFGGPTSIQRTQSEPRTGIDDRGADLNVDNNRSSEKAAKQVWIYDGQKAQDMFGVPRAQVNFIDQFNNNEYTIERGQGAIDDRAAQQRIIQKSIIQPALTAAPVYATTTSASTATVTTKTPAPAAIPAAPLTKTSFDTPAYQAAVEAFIGKKSDAKPMFVTWGENVTPQGDYFVPVSLYVPASTGLTAAQNLTFFGVVQDAEGKPVVVFEEPAKLTETKGDLFYDKSLTLPAGTFKGVFGLADNGKPVTMVSTDMKLAGSLDKATEATSGLILSNNVYTLTQAQNPTDPFAFGGIKVVPKADKTFKNSDDLWYFVEVRNPGLSETNVPQIQVKLDLEGKDTKGSNVKMSNPPIAVDAMELKGVPGHYGIGSSIPLSSFKPGTYTLKVKVIDTVSKQSYTLQDTFTIAG